ncbi:hypothetical protein A2697_00960 [Candidatus Curtissbacteria bacterium RIFCSPHIGHO2_01_FULL_41_44]|uniref:Exosortase/archaeosortase family protein n=1 Tax=Candidatus Curtissbacteria bacterium RIFCSPLOWO2_01_FULL_42_50 TaxID=1797730 RepID=A0A1F5H5S8_9BACT|nr:MAG: hypothetical protein A3C33_04570 [Candidatus Curtissbacteria bacterium RIFCSPHIGHO2_02_FULL_42_58]OGD93945.1 MAG: hypothetical protein A2697_00960 [Candidatus Curtissbacteria bacterium RIFCSPHIGHO2_01_FULL_41_44]OGD99404.1 MAG: hypothetical protein A3B54_00215 [Candidatus Curtissbacteria bacterium RIFCSPLOWO2_01_FULL_42_50]OGE03545.1 MAG: hypothetical protein A3G16_00700 [Candidatus Curtissbacteria bacterium RIFCSPLOWO2_12_FULL_41_16]OGE11699.1 MAG: hypothetical protein A3H87_04065 [Can
MTKRVFVFLFALLAVSLLVLPVITTFDHFLTRVLNSFGGIRIVQEVIVPHEAKIIAVILKPFGFRVAPTPTGIYVNDVLVTIWWSCIGWQSALLIILSLFVGLSRDFPFSSKVETVILAILGFFFLTVFRLTSVAVVGANFGTMVALLYHDYFAATLLTFVFLFGFWWFSYTFVLEEKHAD